MKNLIIFLLCTLPLIGMAQDGNQTSKKKFTTKDKQYNDWSLYAFGGTSLIQTGDLTSINNGVGNWDFGWDFQVGVEKAINHTFGIMFQYQMGQTRQQYVGHFYPNTKLKGTTDYRTYTVLGDIDLTSLFRRFDQTAPYRWSWHGYLGFGFIGYKAKSNALNGYGLGIPLDEQVVVSDESAGLGSFYSQLGTGVRFKISRRVDLEAKMNYYFTGDEEFDGSGDPIFKNIAGSNVHIFSPADIEEQRHDNFITVDLGLNVKLGKHQDHLFWANPYKQDIPQPQAAPPLCQNGDADQDGICDDWDKCLDTPAGARIDGSGCALDVDEDGIIDLYDKCVTVPGTSANQGCPDPVELAQNITDILKGIEFDLDKDVIRPQSKEYLDNAAQVILKYGQGKKFIVEGHTDARGSDAYNINLSQRRMDNVVNYLVSKGVPRDQLIGIGMGKKDLLYPECDPASKCPENLNEANRRVVFKIAPDNKY